MSFAEKKPYHHLPDGTYILISSVIGFKSVSDTVEISSKDPSIDLKIQLNEKIMELDEFVVTATKTPKRKTN